jgi:hypothetical protein
VYGIKDGKRQRFLCIPDIGGSTSSGKIPDWRRHIILDEISGLRVVKKGKSLSDLIMITTQ